MVIGNKSGLIQTIARHALHFKKSYGFGPTMYKIIDPTGLHPWFNLKLWRAISQECKVGFLSIFSAALSHMYIQTIRYWYQRTIL